MATEIRTGNQSRAEIRTYYVDFSDDLPEGATVESAVVTHVPPSGSATTPTVEVSTPVVTVQFGPVSATGWHYLEVLATLSNGDKSSVRLKIPCVY